MRGATLIRSFIYQDNWGFFQNSTDFGELDRDNYWLFLTHPRPELIIFYPATKNLPASGRVPKEQKGLNLPVTS
jgi:hypothetical protein